jgi:sugar phosphate permease
MWLVGLPLVWFFVKQKRPEYYGLLPDGVKVGEGTIDERQMIEEGIKYAAEFEEVEFTIRQAIRTPAFWLLIVANSLRGLAEPTVVLHGIPLLTDIGIDPIKAAGMLAVLALASVSPRIIVGYFADRIKKSRIRFMMGTATLIQTLGITIFLLNQNITTIYIWFIVFGIGTGAGLVLWSPMLARYFGRKAFGSIGGLTSLMMMPIGIFAPIYAGWVYDTTGSYTTAFNIVAILLGISAVLMFLILPPKVPTEVTDIRRIV